MNEVPLYMAAVLEVMNVSFSLHEFLANTDTPQEFTEVPRS